MSKTAWIQCPKCKGLGVLIEIGECETREVPCPECGGKGCVAKEVEQ